MNSREKLNDLDKFIYDTSQEKCKGCTRIEDCKQDLTGLHSVIVDRNGYKLANSHCKFSVGKIISPYRKNILQADSSILSDTQRKICNRLVVKQSGYLFGDSGHGKTTILFNLAKHFRTKRKNIIFDLAHNITTDIKEFEDTKAKMQKLQEIDILFIDDFAREILTQWKILEVWSPILQFRIDNKKPTYISSNYSLTQLFNLIAEKTDETTAQTIAGRLKMIGIFNVTEIDYRTGERI